LAPRLASYVCRLVKSGKSESYIRYALAQRAQTMGGRSRLSDMDLSGAAYAGVRGAPVTLVAYVCVRCPYCTVIIPQLHECVTNGALHGKAKLVIRMFPVKSHSYSKEGGLAFLAAKNQNRGFDFLLKAYRDFRSFSNEDDFIEYAEQLNLNMDRFRRDYNNQSTLNNLIKAKREGLFLNVDATPTFFINGRPYLAETDLTTIQDIVAEELGN